VTAPEQWLPVVGWEGLYEVSDQGHVRSLDRLITPRSGKRPYLRRGRVLRSDFPSARYRVVQFHAEGVKIMRYVHALVLEAFDGPCPEGEEARHGVAGQLDDSLGNLCWGTRGENERDKVRDGTHNFARRTHCPRRHRLVAPNLVADTTGYGYRGCLSCARARAYVGWWRRHRGVVLDLQAESDRRYAQIMGEEAAA